MHMCYVCIIHIIQHLYKQWVYHTDNIYKPREDPVCFLYFNLHVLIIKVG